nr:hypothetical protein CFP56_12951 [Quercus suber]
MGHLAADLSGTADYSNVLLLAAQALMYMPLWRNDCDTKTVQPPFPCVPYHVAARSAWYVSICHQLHQRIFAFARSPSPVQLSTASTMRYALLEANQEAAIPSTLHGHSYSSIAASTIQRISRGCLRRQTDVSFACGAKHGPAGASTFHITKCHKHSHQANLSAEVFENDADDHVRLNSLESGTCGCKEVMAERLSQVISRALLEAFCRVENTLSL